MSKKKPCSSAEQPRGGPIQGLGVVVVQAKNVNADTGQGQRDWSLRNSTICLHPISGNVFITYKNSKYLFTKTKISLIQLGLFFVHILP